MNPYVKPVRQGINRSLWAGSAVIAFLWLAAFAMGAIVVYEVIPLVRLKPTGNLNEKTRS
jgi:hypothetical protein